MGLDPQFGRTATDYARHRRGFPDETLDILAGLGVAFEGKTVVDLGTGAGSLARGMARRGAVVTGLDPSTELMAEAARLDLEWGVRTRYVEATAERTGLESDAWDLVTSGQSWWWFDAASAMREATRLLRSGGHLALCSFDWIPLPGNMVDATETLIERFNPDWHMGGRDGTHEEFVVDLGAGGFEQIRSSSRDLNVPYTHEAWRGRIRASGGVGASLSPEEVESFDAELKNMLMDRFPDDPLQVPHRLYVAIGKRPHG